MCTYGGVFTIVAAYVYRMPRPHSALVVLLVAALVTPVFPAAAGATDIGGTGAVCDRQPALNTDAPPGAVVVDPAVDGDLSVKTQSSPPGTIFWLPPGTHRLAEDGFGQVIPKDGDTYLGAPGAVLDGRGLNRAAFTQQAETSSSAA